MRSQRLQRGKRFGLIHGGIIISVIIAISLKPGEQFHRHHRKNIQSIRRRCRAIQVLGNVHSRLGCRESRRNALTLVQQTVHSIYYKCMCRRRFSSLWSRNEKNVQVHEKRCTREPHLNRLRHTKHIAQQHQLTQTTPKLLLLLLLRLRLVAVTAAAVPLLADSVYMAPFCVRHACTTGGRVAN